MAKIPLFITAKTKIQLTEMGCNEAMIKHMRPEEAWQIIEGKLSIVDYVINKAYELLNINESDDTVEYDNSNPFLGDISLN